LLSHLGWSPTQDRSHAHALALSLHGSSGTGKTFVSNFVQKALFPTDVYGEPIFHGHVFAAPQFHNPSKVYEYQSLIRETILNKLRVCPAALFVFIDTHHFPADTLDILSEFLDAGATNVNGIDYTQAIFILQSNDCLEAVNHVLLKHLEAGNPRQTLSTRVAETALRHCLARSSGHKASGVGLVHKHLLQHVPFLPLERPQLLECIQAQLILQRESGVAAATWANLTWSSEVLHLVADKLDMVGDFALSGCKRVHEQVNTYVMGALDRQNRLSKKCGAMDLFLCYQLHDRHVHLQVDHGKVLVHSSESPTDQLD